MGAVMSFQIDSRLLSSAVYICQWTLSNVYLKNEADFPWFVLVPRVENCSELYQLSEHHQQQLMKEINLLSKLVAEQFNPDKINVGSLGNIVSQLHVHVVGRFLKDPYWPQSIWQSAYQPRPYSDEDLLALQNRFQDLLG